jgi:hypothetical protein
MGSLDKIAEEKELSSHEWERRKAAWCEREKIWAMEEIKVRQRARDREIKEGDRNTSYFFAKANQRKRKKTFPCLEEDGNILIENKDMIDHALQFYKKNFLEKKKEKILVWMGASGKVRRKFLLRKISCWRLISLKKKSCRLSKGHI